LRAYRGEAGRRQEGGRHGGHCPNLETVRWGEGQEGELHAAELFQLAKGDRDDRCLNLESVQWEEQEGQEGETHAVGLIQWGEGHHDGRCRFQG